MLTGGSAPGLAAAAGVTAFLQEHHFGYQTPFAKIPLVSAAVIYDLGLGSPVACPKAADAYEAAKAATSTVEEGSVGAGTGATVGKLLNFQGMMKGGVGLASVQIGGGVMVVDEDNGQMDQGVPESYENLLDDYSHFAPPAAT